MLGVGSGLGLALQVLGMCGQCASLQQTGTHAAGGALCAQDPGLQTEVQAEETGGTLVLGVGGARRYLEVQGEGGVS